MAKRGLGISVLDAAFERVNRVFDDFPKAYLSFSGGKDSSVMFHLVMQVAIRRDRKVGVLIVDLEGNYAMTVQHIKEMISLYSEHIDLYWVCLPMNLRNAVSQFEPQWLAWDPEKKDNWIRDIPAEAISDEGYFPFYRHGMEFEEFIADFGEWYSEGLLTASFVGIRSDESLNRYRTIANKSKSTFCGLQWTTHVVGSLYSAYPIYDWNTKDIWTFVGKFNLPYNKVYDRMTQAGLTIHQQRLCQPYGDEQRKGLWLFHILEPDTWNKVVSRVSGANQGALYARTSGNMLGSMKITKPGDITWQQYAMRLLASMPPPTSEHYKNKIAVFLKWYEDRGYLSGIPDAGQATCQKTPSWTRICRVLLRNDYWCRGLSFSQHKTGAYDKYKKLMEKRRKVWNLI